MKDISKAYHEVFRDMMLRGPEMFKGMYDARFDGGDKFMYGIQTVMEYIALKDDKDTLVKFSEMFDKNLQISEDKARRRLNGQAMWSLDCVHR